MTDRIEILIAKYFSEDLTQQEEQELISWLEKRENKRQFKSYIDVNFAIEQLKDQKRDDSMVWQAIHDVVNKPVRRIRYWKYAVAASVVLFAAINFLFQGDLPKFPQTNVVVNDIIEPATNKAILTLEDGKKVALNEGTEYINTGIKSDGKKITYQTKIGNKAIAYNYLTVPRGGQYNMLLSDGTEVWLNADSKIKYPKSFVAGEDRVVELLYGEAYFDVSSSTNHNGAKFKVLSSDQYIEVLGTEFNVKAYKEDNNTYTTLVEGKVKVSNNQKEAVLSPKQQAVVSAGSKHINIEEVNLYNEISWKNGIFSFDGKTLKEIMIAMSRWYDVDVVFEDKALENTKFIGVFRKTQELNDILNSIKNTNFISSYEVKDNVIILK